MRLVAYHAYELEPGDCFELFHLKWRVISKKGSLFHQTVNITAVRADNSAFFKPLKIELDAELVIEVERPVPEVSKVPEGRPMEVAAAGVLVGDYLQISPPSYSDAPQYLKVAQVKIKEDAHKVRIFARGMKVAEPWKDEHVELWVDSQRLISVIRSHQDHTTQAEPITVEPSTPSTPDTLNDLMAAADKIRSQDNIWPPQTTDSRLADILIGTLLFLKHHVHGYHRPISRASSTYEISTKAEVEDD